jgi:hypothetical protein
VRWRSLAGFSLLFRTVVADEDIIVVVTLLTVTLIAVTLINGFINRGILIVIVLGIPRCVPRIFWHCVEDSPIIKRDLVFLVDFIMEG